MKKKPNDSLVKLAEAALKEAVRGAILDHAKTGDSVVIYKNGKVLEVPARKLRIK
ncbi:MAG: hypothetical protein HYS55_00755 [Candidatus Omnitrophica bacterium]|nr:hypothetical protein [Candidatus Omnitrophota bacterium]